MSGSTSEHSNCGLFHGDPDFCPECGAILPLPGIEDNIKCKECTTIRPVTEFNGLQVSSAVAYNETDQSVPQGLKSSSLGPLVDRKCPKCGHEGMTYTTLQTRSADEGQTVFYLCPQCKFQENENS